MSAIAHESKSSYHFLCPEDLSEEVLDGLLPLSEKLLMDKQQDLVLSLRNIDSIFSVHLTSFVQLYKLLKSFKLKFVIVDISPAVLNVMQMTHLENLLSLFLSLEDYEESLREDLAEEASAKSDEDLQFKYSIERKDGRALVRCDGYMSFGPVMESLQKELMQESEIVFDLTNVGYLDNKVLIVMGGMANSCMIKVQGASSVVVELLELNHLTRKIKVMEEPASEAEL